MTPFLFIKTENSLFFRLLCIDELQQKQEQESPFRPLGPGQERFSLSFLFKHKFYHPQKKLPLTNEDKTIKVTFIYKKHKETNPSCEASKKFKEE